MKFKPAQDYAELRRRAYPHKDPWAFLDELLADIDPKALGPRGKAALAARQAVKDRIPKARLGKADAKPKG